MAFTAEKDAAHRLTLDYTAKGTTAIRVCWIKDNTNGGYTKADGAVVSNYLYSPDKVATTIPAYFNSGMVNAGTYTLTTEIRLNGSQVADGRSGRRAAGELAEVGETEGTEPFGEPVDHPPQIIVTADKGAS